MALIKCQKCGEDVSSNAAYCAHCGVQVNVSSQTGSLEEKNILCLLKYATTLKVIYIILGGIIILVGFVNNSIELIIIGVVFIVLGFIHPTFIENKALLLKNLYELNRKG